MLNKASSQLCHFSGNMCSKRCLIIDGRTFNENFDYFKIAFAGQEYVNFNDKCPRVSTEYSTHRGRGVTDNFYFGVKMKKIVFKNGPRPSPLKYKAEDFERIIAQVLFFTALFCLLLFFLSFYLLFF